jgi:hypothetical protein
MSNDYPLYSVIIDGAEVATVGSDEDAQAVCDGRKVEFIDMVAPANTQRKEWDEPIQHKGYYVPAPCKEEVLDVGNNRAWFKITDLVELHSIGLQMQNALSHEGFAETYSCRMDLYFLIDKNTGKVEVNASFEKVSNKQHMIVAQNNMSPDAKYTQDIDALISAVKMK